MTEWSYFAPRGRNLSIVATRMTHRVTNGSSNGSFDYSLSSWSDLIGQIWFHSKIQNYFPQCLRSKRKVTEKNDLDLELIVYSRVANNTGEPPQK